MKLFASDNRKPIKILSALFSILIVLTASSFALAQQKVSRRFPAGKNVRFELKNITGTITVETWDRDEIAVTALMDNRKATFNPRQTESGLVIDIVGDNRGRNDIEMNFKIQLPSRSSVDLETHSGQINVRNVQGDLVRAHICAASQESIAINERLGRRVQADQLRRTAVEELRCPGGGH